MCPFTVFFEEGCFSEYSCHHFPSAPYVVPFLEVLGIKPNSLSLVWQVPYQVDQCLTNMFLRDLEVFHYLDIDSTLGTFSQGKDKMSLKHVE